MTKLPTPPDNELEPDSQQHGRRQLLKALAAAGGAITLASLPGQWSRPIIEAGVLPAHAQASQFTIMNLNRTLVLAGGLPATCNNNSDPGNVYQISFDYTNSFGGLRPGSTVNHSYEYNLGLAGSFEVVTSAANISGDAFNGTISYTVCSAFGVPGNNQVTTTVFCVDADGRRSNSLSLDSARPPGALENREDGPVFEQER